MKVEVNLTNPERMICPLMILEPKIECINHR